MMDIQNGLLVYYQDGYIILEEVRDGVWTEQSRVWVGEYDHDKFMTYARTSEEELLSWGKEGSRKVIDTKPRCLPKTFKQWSKDK